MTAATNLEELQRLSKKISGKQSSADSIADAIAEIADAFEGGGGGGITIESAALYPDSNNVVKGGVITLSDGTSINIANVYIANIELQSAAGSTSGTTKITTTNVLGAGNSYRYAVDHTPTKPAIAEDVSAFTAWDGVSDIEVADGSVLTIVEADANNKAVKAGTVSVVAAA